jgi:hypothetical protein
MRLPYATHHYASVASVDLYAGLDMAERSSALGVSAMTDLLFATVDLSFIELWLYTMATVCLSDAVLLWARARRRRRP